MKGVLPIHSLGNGYSEVNLRTLALSAERYVKKIEYFLDVQPGETIIDFGCGDGAITILLAKAYPKSRFIGVDYSPDLIDYAMKNNPSKNIEYFSANVVSDHMPIQDLAVDKVFSWGVLQYITPGMDFLCCQNELFRVLKPGGLMCHFQVPLRYGSITNITADARFGVRAFIGKLYLFFLDLLSPKHGDFSYKYSRSDLLRGSSRLSYIKIVPDDYFDNRVSVIFKK